MRRYTDEQGQSYVDRGLGFVPEGALGAIGFSEPACVATYADYKKIPPTTTMVGGAHVLAIIDKWAKEPVEGLVYSLHPPSSHTLPTFIGLPPTAGVLYKYFKNSVGKFGARKVASCLILAFGGIQSPSGCATGFYPDSSALRESCGTRDMQSQPDNPKCFRCAPAQHAAPATAPKSAGRFFY